MEYGNGIVGDMCVHVLDTVRWMLGLGWPKQSCILANVAMQLGRPLVYDPQTRQLVGDEEATRLLRRPYRAPWRHPELPA